MRKLPGMACARCGDQGRGGKPGISPCGGCSGRGRTMGASRVRLDIPPGVGDGEVVSDRLASGDEVVLKVEIEVPSGFRRTDPHLEASCRLPPWHLAEGTTMVVTAPDGKHCRVRVPPGSQPGDWLRLKGKGMPPGRGRGAGDLYLRLEADR